MKYHRKSKRTGQWDKSHCPVRHCFSALSPLDVGHYAYRGEITKSTGVSLTLTQAEDFVFSLMNFRREFISTARAALTPAPEGKGGL